MFYSLRASTCAFRERKERHSVHPSSMMKRLADAVCCWSIWPIVFARCCQSLTIHHQSFELQRLPHEFHGYRILFLTDLHLEIGPNALDALCKHEWPAHDIVILGGDFFDDARLACSHVLKQLLSCFSQPVYAVLGNHDNLQTMRLLESMDVQVLLNESVLLSRGQSSILLTGVDDVSNFNHTHQSMCAEQSRQFPGCKIMVSHSPDFLTEAERYDYSLQLSGHTHGGQWTLFNQMLVKQTKFPFAARGRWSWGAMQGFTSTGIGSSRYPIRNVTPEVAVITLRTPLASKDG